jgi:hypothetical protein
MGSLAETIVFRLRSADSMIYDTPILSASALPRKMLTFLIPWVCPCSDGATADRTNENSAEQTRRIARV